MRAILASTHAPINEARPAEEPERIDDPVSKKGEGDGGIKLRGVYIYRERRKARDDGERRKSLKAVAKSATRPRE